jgi:hypothetical protein
MSVEKYSFVIHIKIGLSISAATNEETAAGQPTAPNSNPPPPTEVHFTKRIARARLVFRRCRV